MLAVVPASLRVTSFIAEEGYTVSGTSLKRGVVLAVISSGKTDSLTLTCGTALILAGRTTSTIAQSRFSIKAYVKRDTVTQTNKDARQDCKMNTIVSEQVQIVTCSTINIIDLSSAAILTCDEWGVNGAHCVGAMLELRGVWA